LSFDLASSRRRLKPQRTSARLTDRLDAQLTFVAAGLGVGGELLLDTNVYIDVIQGRTPAEVDQLLGLRVLNHSTVALAELTHLFGRLDPAHPDTRPTLRELGAAIGDLPARRLTSPSTAAFGEAGMLAGLAARLTTRIHDQALLNDALLLLHAAETGRTLLTRNVKDFDILQQLAPASKVLFYRRT
jgi:predicted nucleic acid-binding protein